MKKFKLIFTVVMLLTCTAIYAQDAKSSEVIQTYQGVKYKINSFTSPKAVTIWIENMSLNREEITRVKMPGADRIKPTIGVREELTPADIEIMKRMEIVRDRVNKIANKFFSTDSTYEGIRIECYYDVKTSNYAFIGGVSFGYLVYSKSKGRVALEDRVTFEKLQELHELLLKSNISGGTWTFYDPTKKYFVLE